MSMHSSIYTYFDNIASFYQKYLALNDKYLGFSFLLLQLEGYWVDGEYFSIDTPLFFHKLPRYTDFLLWCVELFPSSWHLHASLLLSTLQRAFAPALGGRWKFISEANEQNNWRCFTTLVLLVLSDQVLWIPREKAELHATSSLCSNSQKMSHTVQPHS